MSDYIVFQVELEARSPVGQATLNVAAELKPASSLSPSRTKTLSSTADPVTSPVTRMSPAASTPCASKTTLLQFTSAVHSQPLQQPSLSTDATQTARAVAVDDRKGTSAATVGKSKDVITEELEGNMIRGNSQSVDESERITDKFDESYMDDSMSPELPIVGALPATRRTRTTSKQKKITNRQSDQGVRSSSPRKRRSTANDADETVSVPPVPDLARFLTPPGIGANGGRTSDVLEFHSGGHEPSCKSGGRRSVVQDNPEGKDKDSSPSADLSFVFPLPPHVTRICTDLEFLNTDGCKGSDAKNDSPALSQQMTRPDVESNVEEGSESVPGKPDKLVAEKVEERSSESQSIIITDTRKVSDEPEKPLSSRLNRRSSERKSGTEVDIDKVSDISHEELSRQSGSETKSTVETVASDEQRSRQEEKPVSSRLRRKSSSKSDANAPVDGNDLPSTGSVEASALSPEMYFTSPSDTKATVSSGDLELSPQTRSRSQKAGGTVASPRTSGSIRNISDGTSCSAAFHPASESQNTASPERSPVVSPGRTAATSSGRGLKKRASFQLVVNLRSPKSEHRSRGRSSSTSSSQYMDFSSDAQNRSLSASPVRRSLLLGRRRLSPFTPTRSQQHSSPTSLPTSDRKLRPRLRRSQRLVVKNTDGTAGSSMVVNTATISTPTRYNDSTSLLIQCSFVTTTVVVIRLWFVCLFVFSQDDSKNCGWIPARFCGRKTWLTVFPSVI